MIAGMMESFVSEVPANPFVSFCVYCNKGVIKEEMVYEKGSVFHKDCFNKHGARFPAVNQVLLNESSNAKVQLIQLKNLRIRMGGSSSPKPKRKTKKKAKRRKIKKKSRRKVSRKRRVIKRKSLPKRRKTKRKTARRAKRKTRSRR